MIDSSQSTSTRPYLLRALYEWCADNGLTPYVAAYVDDTVKVPREHVKNNEIVLNISMDATSNLQIGNEFLQFKARFGGQAREIVVPIGHIIAIYARENGQGMAFPVPQALQPRGEVKESPAAERRNQGLRPVRSTPQPEPEAAEMPQDNPLLQPSIEPAKIVKLKAASPAKTNAPPTTKPDSHPDPADPKPPSGSGSSPNRPSLTRIK
jgi:stringent starvation protein B